VARRLEVAKLLPTGVLNLRRSERQAVLPAIRIRTRTRIRGITWDEATFREYIKDPKAKVPGTKMIYAGMKDEQKTNDLVAFLKQFDADGKKK
jgi:cytochrome c